MTTLIFVYNAKSGVLSALFDAGHKLLSPKSYQCNLCALTHSTFGKNEVWNEFREQSSIQMIFYHINEFESTFPQYKFDYPIVLKKSETSLEIVLNSYQLNAIKTVDNLINEIKNQSLSIP